jgi:hypothetical protein
VAGKIDLAHGGERDPDQQLERMAGGADEGIDPHIGRNVMGAGGGRDGACQHCSKRGNGQPPEGTKLMIPHGSLPDGTPSGSP